MCGRKRQERAIEEEEAERTRRHTGDKYGLRVHARHEKGRRAKGGNCKHHVFSGVFHASAFPAMTGAWGAWAPPLERTKLNGLSGWLFFFSNS